MTTTQIMLARPSSTSAKCTHRIDVPVSEDTRDDAQAMARMCGQTLAEWVRLLMERELYGAFHGTRTIARRLSNRPSDDRPTLN